MRQERNMRNWIWAPVAGAVVGYVILSYILPTELTPYLLALLGVIVAVIAFQNRTLPEDVEQPIFTG